MVHSKQFWSSILSHLLCCLLLLVAVQGKAEQQSASASSSAAPWQAATVGTSGDRLDFRGLPPFVFAPGGRLYSVECMVAAAGSIDDESSNLVVAISCQEGLVVVSTLHKSPHLSTKPTTVIDSEENSKNHKKMNESTQERQGHRQPLWILDDEDGANPSYNFHVNPPFLCLSPLSSALTSSSSSSSSSSSQRSFTSLPLMAVCAGNAVDSQLLQRKIQRLAEGELWNSIHSSSGTLVLDEYHAADAAVIARQLADHLQVPTQTVGARIGRILASSALIFGGAKNGEVVDTAVASFPLWRADPTGQFWSCHAAVIGRGSTQAEQKLLDLAMPKRNERFKEQVLNYRDVHEHLQSLTVQEALSLSCRVIQQTLEKSPSSYRWRALAIVRNKSNQRRPFLLRLYKQAELDALLTKEALAS